jgi:hypothetical protein
MTTLFRNALVLAMDDEYRAEQFRADVLELPVPDGATVIDATNRLLMPR